MQNSNNMLITTPMVSEIQKDFALLKAETAKAEKAIKIGYIGNGLIVLGAFAASPFFRSLPVTVGISPLLISRP